MAVAIAIGTFAGILGVFGSEGFVIGRRLTNASYAFGTMSSRFMVWTSVAMNMASDPAMLVFGMGPQKESETRVVGGDIDSDYVTILKRYGLIGFLCFGLFVTSVVAALRIPALVETGAAQGWRFGAVLMLLVILVSDLTNVVYVNNQLMDVFMFLLGSALSSDRDVTEQLFGFRDSVSRPVGSRARSSKLAATMERP
jgi:hypothetical protein